MKKLLLSLLLLCGSAGALFGMDEQPAPAGSGKPLSMSVAYARAQQSLEESKTRRAETQVLLDGTNLAVQEAVKALEESKIVTLENKQLIGQLGQLCKTIEKIVQEAPAAMATESDHTDLYAEYKKVTAGFENTQKWVEDYVGKSVESFEDRALNIRLPQEMKMITSFIDQVTQIGDDLTKAVAKEQLMRQVVTLHGEIVADLSAARKASMQSVVQDSDSEATDSDIDFGSFKRVNLDDFLREVSESQTKSRLGEGDSDDSDDEEFSTVRRSDPSKIDTVTRAVLAANAAAAEQDIEHRKMLRAQRLTQCNIYYDTQHGYFVANQRKHIRKTLKDVLEKLAEVGAQQSVALDEKTADQLLHVLTQFDVGLDEQAVENIANLCPNETQKATMRGRKTIAGDMNDGKLRKRIPSIMIRRTKSEKTIKQPAPAQQSKNVKVTVPSILAVRQQPVAAPADTRSTEANKEETAIIEMPAKKEPVEAAPVKQADRIDVPCNPTMGRLSLREKVLTAFVPGYFPSYGFEVKSVSSIDTPGTFSSAISSSVKDLYFVQNRLKILSVCKNVSAGLFAGFAAWRMAPRGNGMRGLVAAGVCGIASYLWNKRAFNKTYNALERGLVDQPETSYLNQLGSALHLYCEPKKERFPMLREELLSNVEVSIRNGLVGINQRLGILNRLRGYRTTPQ